MKHEMDEREKAICSNLLDDAGVIIDSFNSEASTDAKNVVSCRMVMRAIAEAEMSGIPMGATQGSMGALGYTESWTIGSGSVGELYLSKIEKQMLGGGGKIGSYSPVEAMAPEADG
jgi:hypothetical protein